MIKRSWVRILLYTGWMDVIKKPSITYIEKKNNKGSQMGPTNFFLSFEKLSKIDFSYGKYKGLLRLG